MRKRDPGIVRDPFYINVRESFPSLEREFICSPMMEVRNKKIIASI